MVQSWYDGLNSITGAGGVSFGVNVGVMEGVRVGVIDGVMLGVTDEAGEGVADGAGEGVADGARVEVSVGVTLAVGVHVGSGASKTPTNKAVMTSPVTITAPPNNPRINFPPDDNPLFGPEGVCGAGEGGPPFNCCILCRVATTPMRSPIALRISRARVSRSVASGEFPKDSARLPS